MSGPEVQALQAIEAAQACGVPVDLATDAAMHGETIREAAIRRCRDALNRRHSVTANKWRGMSVQLREVLVTMCTDRRDCERAALGAWEDLTQNERIAIGAQARVWAKQLQEAAGWLR